MSEMAPGLPKHPIGTFAFLEWAEPVGVPDGGYRVAIWDKVGLCFGVAIAVTALAYVIPLSDLLHLTRYGSPDFKPF